MRGEVRGAGASSPAPGRAIHEGATHAHLLPRQGLRLPLHAGWNAQRVHVMRWVLRMKREANPAEIDAVLAAPRDRPIVEISARDPWWLRARCASSASHRTAADDVDAADAGDAHGDGDRVTHGVDGSGDDGAEDGYHCASGYDGSGRVAARRALVPAPLRTLPPGSPASISPSLMPLVAGSPTAGAV